MAKVATAATVTIPLLLAKSDLKRLKLTSYLISDTTIPQLCTKKGMNQIVACQGYCKHSNYMTNFASKCKMAISNDVSLYGHSFPIVVSYKCWSQLIYIRRYICKLCGTYSMQFVRSDCLRHTISSQCHVLAYDIRVGRVTSLVSITSGTAS